MNRQRLSDTHAAERPRERLFSLGPSSLTVVELLAILIGSGTRRFDALVVAQEGVGIDAIMAAAGLTRGGFYGYFRSKAELFAEVMRGEHDFNKRLQARGGKTPDELTRQALDVVAGYLHPDNRGRVGQGCTMASLSVDIARAGKRARRHHTAQLRALVAELERGLEDAHSPDPRALAAVALCVGGISLARALDDEALVQALLAACEAAAAEQLSGDLPAS